MSVVTPIVSTEHARPPRPALGPHALAQRVPCRICAAETGRPCRDGDDVREDPHHSRWIIYQRASRTRPFLAVVLRDIDADLRAGDVVTCGPSENGLDVAVLADSLGRLGRPDPISLRDVEFRAFVGPSAEADRHTVRSGAARRAHARSA